jgi:hypothetical protein
MPGPDHDAFEERLHALFAAAQPALDDDGFSRRVVARLRRRRWLRAGLIFGAGGVGLALALWPATQLVISVAAGFGQFLAMWGEPAWLENYRLLMFIGLFAFLSPALLALVDE